MTSNDRAPHSGIVYVLSPHSDDACLSVGLAITAWRRAGLAIRIVTFFTRSGYARGRAAGTDPEEVGRISALRAAEDLTFTRAVGVPPPLDLGWEDAPLRRKIRVRDVFARRALGPEDETEAEALSQELRSLPEPLALVAPLAIGHHLDHRVVLEAAVRVPEVPIAFYEDLPYAAGRSEADRAAAAAAAGRRAGRSLEAIVVRRPGGSREKRRLALCYRSQIGWWDLRRLVWTARRHGNGERLWVERQTRFLGSPGASDSALGSSDRAWRER